MRARAVLGLAAGAWGEGTSVLNDRQGLIRTLAGIGAQLDSIGIQLRADGSAYDPAIFRTSIDELSSAVTMLLPVAAADGEARE